MRERIRQWVRGHLLSLLAPELAEIRAAAKQTDADIWAAKQKTYQVVAGLRQDMEEGHAALSCRVATLASRMDALMESTPMNLLKICQAATDGEVGKAVEDGINHVLLHNDLYPSDWAKTAEVMEIARKRLTSMGIAEKDWKLHLIVILKYNQMRGRI